MDNSSTPSFTNLLNSSSISSSSPQDPNSKQNPSFPPSFPLSYPPQQFAPNFQPHQYPPNFNLFGGHAGYQQFQSSSYHGVPFQSSFGTFPPGSAGGPSSPVGSAALFGAAGGSGSRGDEYSPVSSPANPAVEMLSSRLSRLIDVAARFRQAIHGRPPACQHLPDRGEASSLDCFVAILRAGVHATKPAARKELAARPCDEEGGGRSTATRRQCRAASARNNTELLRCCCEELAPSWSTPWRRLHEDEDEDTSL